MTDELIEVMVVVLIDGEPLIFTMHHEVSVYFFFGFETGYGIEFASALCALI